MLYTKRDAATYNAEFTKRFTSFCEKAPVLLDFSLTPSKIQVVDKLKQTVYEFDWDYTLDVKEFIHGIKEVLKKKCYPFIYKEVTKEEEIPIEEQAELVKKGIPIEQVPTKREILKLHSFMIDKVVVYKDIFILEDVETGKFYKYKLDTSSIFFLKKYHSGKMNKKEAGAFFFKHAQQISEVERKYE